MKKILLAAFAIMLSTAAFAQVDFGIKGGLNYTKMSQVKLDGNSSDFKPGFHAGLFADINLLVVGIRPELLYSQKGFEVDSEDGKVKSTLNYIDVPVMVKFNPAPIVGLYLGPQVSFLLGENWKNLGETFDPDKNTTEFSGVVGAGLRLGKLDLGARYNFGLSKVVKDDQGRFENFDKGRNQVLQLSVGYVLSN